MLSRIADFHDISVCVTYGERSSRCRKSELAVREVSSSAELLPWRLSPSLFFVHGMERADATFVFCETSAAILRFSRVQLNTYFQYNINTSITTTTIFKVCVTVLVEAEVNAGLSGGKRYLVKLFGTY